MIGDGVVVHEISLAEAFESQELACVTKTKAETKRGQDLVWFKDISVS